MGNVDCRNSLCFFSKGGIADITSMKSQTLPAA